MSGGDWMDMVWAGDEWVIKGNQQRPYDTHGKIFIKSMHIKNKVYTLLGFSS